MALSISVSALPVLESRWSSPYFWQPSTPKSTFIDFIGKRGAEAWLCDLDQAVLPTGEHERASVWLEHDTDPL